MTQTCRHAIGICTFRRPVLLDTLASLDAQSAPEGDGDLILIVADNDTEQSARSLVTDFGARCRHEIVYVHAPAANISLARNAILESAEARGIRYLAFIDDDERASAGWYRALHSALVSQQADAVVGPVHAYFEDGAPGWMLATRSHDTEPEVDEKGRPLAGHSCNVLIDLEAAPFSGLRFDLERGRTGGEDTAFFEAARRKGATFALASDAIVEETVVPHRASLAWLLRRRYRMGQTYASLAIDHGFWKRARFASVAVAKIFYCGGAALLSAASTARRNSALVRGALHVGAASEALGGRRVQIYGQLDEHSSIQKGRSDP